MRLTAGTEATVVRGLRGQAGRFARAEYEARDRSLERRSILPQEAVMAFHPAFTRLQNAEALVLVDSTGPDGRLLADHALPDHFRVDSVPARVVNQPPPREKLCGESPDVFDAHEVREHVVALRGLRVIAKVNGSDSDTNSFGFTIEKAPGCHVFKLVDAPYQMTGLTESGLTMGSPGLQPN